VACGCEFESSIATSGLVNQAGGVTHVSGTKRHPCLGSLIKDLDEKLIP